MDSQTWGRIIHLASAAGSQVDGTAFLTWSQSTIWDFSKATEYSEMNTPSKERVLVLAASFCQQPENSNMALKKPEGIFPVNDNSWLNCSDIWCKKKQRRKKEWCQGKYRTILYFPLLFSSLQWYTEKQSTTSTNAQSSILERFHYQQDGNPKSSLCPLKILEIHFNSISYNEIHTSTTACHHWNWKMVGFYTWAEQAMCGTG